VTENSENYIFGKFDTFIKRLEKIADMARQMGAYSGLVEIRIDGIEQIAARYKKIVDTAKKRNYDVLDHRKQEVRACTEKDVIS
jgi:dynein heavy chain